VLSSPLRTNKVNVPLLLSTFATSQRMLSNEPDFNEPSLNWTPASVVPVLLLKISPLPIDFNTNGWIDELSDATSEDEMWVDVADVKDPDTTRVTKQEFPPCWK